MYRRIRDLREDHDLFQKDIAAYLQCSQVSYSHYELGKRDIPTDVLIKLASFYHEFFSVARLNSAQISKFSTRLNPVKSGSIVTN